MTKALQITFDERSLSRLLKKLSVETLVDAGMDEFQDGFADAVAAKAKKNAEPNRDSGDLIRGIKVQKGGFGTSKGRVVAATAPHSVFVHDGTRPHWPPLDAVRGWAARHGFPGPFLVAKSISETGTEANPFLKDAYDEQKMKLEPGLKSYARSVERKFGR